MCTWCVYIFRFSFRAEFFLHCYIFSYIAMSASTLEYEKVISLLYFFIHSINTLSNLFIYLNLSVIHLNETSIIEHFLLQLPGEMSFRIFHQEYNKTVWNDHDLCKSVLQSTSFDTDYETF